MKLTIRLKLLIGFTLLLTLSSAVQGLAFVLTKQYILAQVSSAQEVEAEKGAKQIQNFFTTLGTESRKLGQAYATNPEEISPIANYIVENNDYIRGITYLSPLGRELVKFDAGGQVLNENLSYEVFSEPFKSAITGQPAISKVYYLKDPYFDMFYPLFDEKHTIIGAIKLQINLIHLRNELASIRLGESGFIYVVDELGRLIAHPSEAYVLERPKLISRSVIEHVFNGTKSTSEDEQYANEKNIPVVAKAVEVPDYHWVVVLEQPISEAFGFLNFIQSFLIATLIGSFLGLFIIAFVLSANLTRSLRKLQHSAQLVEQGQLDKIVAIKSGDEIETLSHSFVSLIDKLITREHTLESTTSQLTVANARLQQLDKLKDEFVSVASHELRTPMTAIKSYLWMALDGRGGPISEKQKFYLQRAYNSVDRLIRLVSDMLNVSRIDSGRITLQLGVLDIQKTVQEVFDEVMPRIQELGINLIMAQTQAFPQVLADSDKVKEVLFNLIGNAMKFTPKGGTITVSFIQKENIIETTVSDTGTGIDPANIDKLFQKFSMIADSYMANSSIQGTGLGLYISKSIVELHGGKIWATSQGHGKGTQFTFSLKVATEEDRQKIAQNPVDEAKPMIDIIHTGV